ncbi:MAG: DUF4856 domain-containing protein [Cyclobacteriaceae bacterium]|nr:DUF4856 domain-containing protein [Cyclobacteriaceae bacterium HetDA_MAG_MS6]
MRKLAFLYVLIVSFALSSCSDDDGDDVSLDVPDTYNFTRDGSSTVSFTGQTNRLDMLSEIKAYVQNGDQGQLVEEQTLLNMFANENAPFSDADLNTSGKQLESKTFSPDIAYYKDLFDQVASASAAEVASPTTASAGVAGRIERGTSGKFILVDEKGQEFTQLIEKGLMGSVFLYQIYNVYLTDARIGDDLDNETLVEGKSYTAVEHHWDEAFGYWGVPIDFPGTLADEDRRFWANYSYGRESLIGSVTKLKNAFLTGRTAIANDVNNIKKEQRDILYQEFELMVAATVIHYINDAVSDFNGGDQGNLLHHLSEAHAFMRSLRLSPEKAISDDQINTILNSDFGTDGDLWTVTLNGLQTAKTTLTTVYPSLADVADDL